MYAVIKSGGKQHRVEEGEQLKLEKIEAATGETIESVSYTHLTLPTNREV